MTAARSAGKNRLNETEPRRLPGAGHMIDADADARWVFQRAPAHREKRTCKLGARRRSSMLIATTHDRLRLCKTQHGGEKIRRRICREHGISPAAFERHSHGTM